MSQQSTPNSDNLITNKNSNLDDVISPTNLEQQSSYSVDFKSIGNPIPDKKLNETSSIREPLKTNAFITGKSNQTTDPTFLNLQPHKDYKIQLSDVTSWPVEAPQSNIVRDCSDLTIGSSDTSRNTELLRTSDSRVNISSLPTSISDSVTLHNNISRGKDISSHEDADNLIYIGDTTSESIESDLTTVDNGTHSLTECDSRPSRRIQQPYLSNPGDSKRVRFKSLLTTKASTNRNQFLDISQGELSSDLGHKTRDFTPSPTSTGSQLGSPLLDDQEEVLLERSQLEYPGALGGETTGGQFSDEDEIDDHYDDDEDFEFNRQDLSNNKQKFALTSLNAKQTKSSKQREDSKQPFIRQVTSRFSLFSRSSQPYIAYEDKDLLTGASKYQQVRRRRHSTGRTFRGKYRYSRAEISMAIFKKMLSFLFQRASLALFGAFLIHVTLGTVYTLSNINSYLTSYLRLHGYPKATYGGSVWISSSYAVGQGFSMVLGGYIEKRFSARIACSLGCALHSMSIMSTSWAVNHGPLAVLVTYGFLPGFGCGLAYMTPMSNGFGWFPNRKGLVAGVILAGFGIGTFVFNMAQTAFVNPENLSPLDGQNGYFTQLAILERVPKLFIFMGSIYAAMQFIGCCLLFRPSTTYTGSSKSLDERPILMEQEMSLRQAIGTREFAVLFCVYGLTTQGVLFVNSMLKEYGQIFISDDMYLAWVGSMASIANSLGRLAWGLAIDRYTFKQCFTAITIIFGTLLFLMPYEFILSSKLLYLLCTLGLFGSFSGWMSTYPVHLSRVFGRTNSGMVYGLIFISQSACGILTALGSHYLIDHFNRFVPFFCMAFLELVGLLIYHLFSLH